MRRRIVASRGRYNENGAITQHCELLKGKCTNTITTVTKDNYILVKKEEAYAKKSNDKNGR